MKPQIAAIPFLIGDFVYSFFAGESFAFPIGLSFICLVLVLTGKMKII